MSRLEHPQGRHLAAQTGSELRFNRLDPQISVAVGGRPLKLINLSFEFPCGRFAYTHIRTEPWEGECSETAEADSREKLIMWSEWVTHFCKGAVLTFDSIWLEEGEI